MQQFILNIYNFLYTILYGVYSAVTSFSLTNINPTYSTNEIKTRFYNFLDKNVFLDNSLIGLNVTWFDTFVFLSTIFLTIFFIVLFIRFIWSLLTIIKDSATKWR